MSVRNVGSRLAVVLVVAAASGCSRNPSSQAAPTVTPTAPAQPSPPAPAPATAAEAGAPAAPATPSGPRAELTGEHYALTVALAPPATVPGESTLTVELRGTGGFHVNELYPTAVDLQATNATTRPQLRRGDGQISQQLAAFRVPVQVTGAGATVRGTMRFAVCSEENCVPQERAFAVALP
jgi:hypothetical protein